MQADPDMAQLLKKQADLQRCIDTTKLELDTLTNL